MNVESIAPPPPKKINNKNTRPVFAGYWFFSTNYRCFHSLFELQKKLLKILCLYLFNYQQEWVMSKNTQIHSNCQSVFFCDKGNVNSSIYLTGFTRHTSDDFFLIYGIILEVWRMMRVWPFIFKIKSDVSPFSPCNRCNYGSVRFDLSRTIA